MRGGRLLALFPLVALLGAAGPRERRFDAWGVEPRWSLTIEREVIVLKHAAYSGAMEGGVDAVGRSAGHVQLKASIETVEMHPLGNSRRTNKPVFWVETSLDPLGIDISETGCTDAKQRVLSTQVTLTMSGGRQYHGCGESLVSLEIGLARPAT